MAFLRRIINIYETNMTLENIFRVNWLKEEYIYAYTDVNMYAYEWTMTKLYEED